MTQQQPTPNPGFTPTWRYNPLKRQLQFWFSPVNALVFAQPFLDALAQADVPPFTFGEALQVASKEGVLAIGGWRNLGHEALSKLPISTR